MSFYGWLIGLAFFFPLKAKFDFVYDEPGMITENQG